MSKIANRPSSHRAAMMIGVALTLAFPAGVLAQDSTGAVASPQPRPVLLASSDSAGARPDRLPFAGNPLPMEFPRLGAGFGAGAYVGGMDDIEQAFRAMEDAYRAAGFDIYSPPVFEPDPMLIYTLTLSVSRRLDLTGQVGDMDSGSGRLRTAGVLVTGRVASTAGEEVALYAGLGAGNYRFSFTGTYNAAMPRDSTGGYWVLDDVTLEGGGTYWSGAGRLALRPRFHMTIDLIAQYLGTSEVSADTPHAGRISVHMSGVLLGAALTLFY